MRTGSWWCRGRSRAKCWRSHSRRSKARSARSMICAPAKSSATCSPNMESSKTGEVMPFKCNQPAVPTVQQDDATARITRWDFAVGAATGWHTHGWPYFVVMLTDAVMKVEAVDGQVREGRLVAGQSYRRPTGIEHDVMNGADQPMAFVEIEVKQP